jgi:hypothetical protein
MFSSATLRTSALRIASHLYTPQRNASFIWQFTGATPLCSARRDSARHATTQRNVH